MGRVRAVAERVFAMNGVFLLVLVALFVLSFAIPVVVASRVLFDGNGPSEWASSAWGSSASPAISDSSEVQGRAGALFPRAFEVSGGGRFIRIPSSLGVEATPERDLLIVGWFRVARTPRDGERMVLFAKAPELEHNPEGYALVLTGEREVVRPQILWRSSNGEGRWFSFAEVAVVPDTWMMFALSVRGSRYIGLHGATYFERGDGTGSETRPKVSLLGGVDLGEPVTVANKRALLIGAFPGSRFRGEVGGVLVATPPSLDEDLKGVLKEMTSSPREFPSALPRSDVVVWYGFGSDPSENVGDGIETEAPARAGSHAQGSRQDRSEG